MFSLTLVAVYFKTPATALLEPVFNPVSDKHIRNRTLP